MKAPASLLHAQGHFACLTQDVEDGTLSITGDRKYGNEENGKKYHRVERAYSGFGRSFSLPDDANPAKATAEFKDGVLKVHLAKNEKSRPQQVEIGVS